MAHCFVIRTRIAISVFQTAEEVVRASENTHISEFHCYARCLRQCVLEGILWSQCRTELPEAVASNARLGGAQSSAWAPALKIWFFRSFVQFLQAITGVVRSIRPLSFRPRSFQIQ